MRVFDMSRGLEVGNVESKTLCVSHLAVSPDGRTILIFYNLHGGKDLRKKVRVE